MLKTLLVLCGVLVVSATGLQAQGARGAAGRGAFVGHGGAFAAARPSSYRGYNHGGGYDHGNRNHHGGYRGHYYYLGGIPYFYPFGFGYPYYGGFYGDGFGYGYGGGYPYGDGAYNGRIADNADNNGAGGGSLPEAVQRQLSKRGYYKGSVDGQFGPESRSALSRFQRKQGLKETGKIDEPTLEALGFTDRR